MAKAGWIKRRPIAHRGYHDMNNLIWENTASAFERAILADFAIECDLQMAADGTPMVFHDPVLDRLCDREGKVRRETAATLTALRVGGTRDTIPTLAQMLGQVDGRVGLVIELKVQDEADTGVFARTVLEGLSGYKGRVALMSFDHTLLRALIALDPPFPIGLTAYEMTETQARHNAVAQELPLDFVSFHYSDLPSPFVEAMRARDLPVITWTVRDRAGVALSRQYADQITFEGFDPDALQS